MKPLQIMLCILCIVILLGCGTFDLSLPNFPVHNETLEMIAQVTEWLESLGYHNERFDFGIVIASGSEMVFPSVIFLDNQNFVLFIGRGHLEALAFCQENDVKAILIPSLTQLKEFSEQIKDLVPRPIRLLGGNV